MIFEFLLGAGWWALQLAVCALILAGLVYPAMRVHRKHRERGTVHRWEPIVQNAQRYNADAYHNVYRGYNEPIRGEVSVRIKRGSDFLTIGTASVEAEDFEQRLAGLVADAEERAAALNAHQELMF